jgi:membrane protein involved in colicin uptake
MSEERKEEKREKKSSTSFAGCLLSVSMALMVILLAVLLWPSLRTLFGIFWLQMQMLLSWLGQYR